MHVLVQAAYHKYLFVVPDWLSPIEFFWLLQSAVLHPSHGRGLGVEAVAVADPAVVASKDQQFVVIESKTAKGVSWRPSVVLINDRHQLPLLLGQVLATIQALNGLQWGLIHGVPSSNYIQELGLKDSDGVVVSWLIHISDFVPLILRDVVHLALPRSLVRVLRADCVNEVFGLVLLLFDVDMGQLMT